MRYYGLVVVLGGFVAAVAPSAVRARDSTVYVVAAPDILRLNVTGLPKKAQPVKGEFLVRPDGTITLGTYGSVTVSGLTLDQARATIIKHLATHVKKKKKDKLGALVEVTAYNSKNYYVIYPSKGVEQVFRVPITGNDTVAEAVRQVKGVAELAVNNSVWIARPTSTGKADQILRVDWEGIVSESRTATNYQIMPDDRVYVAISPSK